MEPSNELKIQGKTRLTVIGHDIEGDFKVSVSDIVTSVKDLLENSLKRIVGEKFKNGKYIGEKTERKALNVDERLPYSHLLIDELTEENLPNLVANAQEGSEKLECGGNMGLELEEFYIKEMCDERPEFQSMLNIYKSNANDGSALIGRTIDEVYEPTKALAEMLTKIVDKKMKENDPNALDGCDGIIAALKKYREYTEPAMANVQEIKNRFKSVGDSIDLEKGKKLHRDVRNSMNVSDMDSSGIHIMRERDYDRLYNKIEKIVEENFPYGEKSKFFHFGNEEGFFKALYNSRKQSGCAYVDDKDFEHEMQMFRNKMGSNEYRPRL